MTRRIPVAVAKAIFLWLKRLVARLVETPTRDGNALEGLFEGVARTAVDDEAELFSTGEYWS